MLFNRTGFAAVGPELGDDPLNRREVVNATAYFAALNTFLSQYGFKTGGGAAK